LTSTVYVDCVNDDTRSFWIVASTVPSAVATSYVPAISKMLRAAIVKTTCARSGPDQNVTFSLSEKRFCSAYPSDVSAPAASMPTRS
jgi:hypothetical protein